MKLNVHLSAFHMLVNVVTNIRNGHIHFRYLLYQGVPIVWEHWQGAYNYNKKYGIRLHHKLTKEHVFLTNSLKMRNYLAEDVLSTEMLSLMRNYQSSVADDLSSTIKLLEQTSLLVSIFTDCRRPIHSKADQRLKTIQGILNFFRE